MSPSFFRTGASILTGEAERAIDAVLAGPLPEALGRSLAEHDVLERIAAGMLDSEQDAVEELAHRFVNTPAFKQALTEVLSGPEVRAALSSQASGFGEEVSEAGGRRLRALDRRLDALARRLLRRKPAGEERARFGGPATRGAGLVLDALLAQLAFVVAASSVTLVLALAGGLGPTWLDGTLAGAGWLLAAAAYFVVFWSATGQTPGMRVVRVRVVGPSGAPPSALRSLVRFAGLILAIIPLFAGFLPVLVDGRRRGLQDFLAGTVVLDESAAPL